MFPSRETRRLTYAAAAILAAAVLLAAPGSAAADDAKAREIMQKVQDREDGDNSTSRLEMTLIDKDGNKRVRQIQAFGKDKGKDSLQLMFFLEPADVKDTGFLTYDYDEAGKDDDQWLFLPALRKTKRIASDDKSGSFMGSDFNYSDMSERDLEDYDYKLIKEDEVDGQKTWVIEASPRSDEIAEESGYDRSIAWIRQDIHMVVRVAARVHNSRRTKRMQVNRIEQIDGVWVATELQMQTFEGRTAIHGTVLRQLETRFNQDLSEDMFSVRRLEKGL